MDWDILKVLAEIAIGVYNAGGAQMRWVVWIWCAFIFLYLLLGKYDSIHKKSIINHREKAKKNYFYALHLFGAISAVIEYGYLLQNWPVHFPIAWGSGIGVMIGIGFAFLGGGFIFVVLGRLYLNSFWGKDIYSYEDKEKYKLVKENVYGLCRHPIYFGQVCMCMGTAFVLNNWIIVGLSFLMICMNYYRAKREDAYLEAWFGDEWKEYENKVNFFVPSP